MSTTKYFNKKANRILVYEVIPHTDPITNKSKPIRKYIGYEDPASHIFTPSSGKPGRPKKAVSVNSSGEENHDRELYATLYAEIDSLKDSVASLSEMVENLCVEKKSHMNQISSLKRIMNMIGKLVEQALELD